MKKSLLDYSLVALALPVLMTGCVRAAFAPSMQDSSTTSLPEAGPEQPGVCLAPAPTCTLPTAPSTGCDPDCQTGQCKWCSDKCTVSGYDGNPQCVNVDGAGASGDGCNIFNLGRPNQSDSCARGFICMGDYANPTPNTHCFQLCQSSADCSAVSCNKRPVAPPAAVGASPFTASVCDPSYRTCSGTQLPYYPCCNPTDGTGCDVGEICYLVSQVDPQTRNNRTVCEYWSGNGNASSLCTSSTDCGLGWFCSSGHCLMACDLAAPNPCNGGKCNSLGNQFGFCN